MESGAPYGATNEKPQPDGAENWEILTRLIRL